MTDERKARQFNHYMTSKKEAPAVADTKERDSEELTWDPASDFQETIEAEQADIDNVNHPSHYNQYQGFEVVDVCEQLRAPDGSGNYNRGSVFKYLARAGWKDPKKQVEDLEKAAFYLQREIERCKTGATF